uniref:Putative secreted peptide n=1 Tax=Anopheles braziliensis TaxID=58242 RepID=A0A2M3ZMP2_9DIPT
MMVMLLLLIASLMLRRLFAGVLGIHLPFWTAGSSLLCARCSLTGSGSTTILCSISLPMHTDGTPRPFRSPF